MTATLKPFSTPALALIAVAALAFPIAAGEAPIAGTLAVVDAAGVIKMGVTGTGLFAVGRFEKAYDNTLGGDGAFKAEARPGVFGWFNSTSGDQITSADVGSLAYIVDNCTVAKTDGGSTRSVAGVIIRIGDDPADLGKVYVATGFGFFAQPTPAPGGPFLLTKTATIGEAALTDAVAGEAQAINIGTALPANALVMGVRATLTTQFTGGAVSAVVLDVGYAGSTESVMKDLDVFGSVAAGAQYTDGSTAKPKPVAASAKQLIATFTPDGGHALSALTAGSVKVDVFYVVES